MSSKKETVTEIPISKIKDFPDHPYQVRDDDSMTELVESVKERGLIQPVLVIISSLKDEQASEALKNQGFSLFYKPIFSIRFYGNPNAIFTDRQDLNQQQLNI